MNFILQTLGQSYVPYLSRGVHREACQLVGGNGGAKRWPERNNHLAGLAQRFRIIVSFIVIL
jgi:hypothetical protein